MEDKGELDADAYVQGSAPHVLPRKHTHPHTDTHNPHAHIHLHTCTHTHIQQKQQEDEHRKKYRDRAAERRDMEDKGELDADDYIQGSAPHVLSSGQYVGSTSRSF